MINTFKKAAINLVKNWTTAIPTVLVMGIVLTMFHGLLVVHTKAKMTLNTIQNKFSITVYLKDNADPFEVGNLITMLEERNDVVKPVTYTSKEAAWQMMVKSFSLDNELLKKYKFSLPASLTITPGSPKDTAAIGAFLETNAKNLLRDPLTSKDKQKNITNEMIEFLQSVQDSTLKTIVMFIILFVIGGSLLLSSAIHLAISSRHREISIMKLVGASYSTIIMPFIVEGFLISIAAFLLNLALIFLIPFQAKITDDKLYMNAALIECLAAIVLGISISYLTTLFHIKKKHLFS